MDYNKPPPYNPEEVPYPQPQQGYPNPPQGYPHPPQGYPHPPQGYPHPPQPYPPIQSQPVHVTMQQAPPPTNTVIVTAPSVVVTGNCPGCRVGNLGYSFTCCGVCCAIIFFPVGIICCFLFAKKRCSHCRGYF